MKSEKKYLVVRSLETQEEVRRIDVTGRGERALERIERGLLMQMDTDRFYFGEEGEAGS